MCVQVAAQTGHSVWLGDVKQELLDKAESSISASVQRVAKKTFAKDPKVCVRGFTCVNLMS